MAVRIGVGLGGWPFPHPDPELLWRYVETAERLGVDSIWLTDRIVSGELNMEPLVALSFIAARTTRLKFGTSVLALPLRNPTVLAKEVATLDFLSGGRTLPAIGLGTESDREYEACGSSRGDRAGRTDEAILILRRLWSEDEVVFEGEHFQLHGVTVQPKPVQEALPPIWIGGRSAAAIRRVARLGDGWLVSQATPAEVCAGIGRIRDLTASHGREIEDDHYGALFGYCIADSAREARTMAEPYLMRRRDDVDVGDISAFGTPDEVRALVDAYVQAGATKFVARPVCPPDRTLDQLELLGSEVVPHYHGGAGDGPRSP